MVGWRVPAGRMMTLSLVIASGCRTKSTEGARQDSSGSAPSGPSFSNARRDAGNRYEVAWNGYWFDPKEHAHALAAESSRGDPAAPRAWILQLTEAPGEEDARRLQSLGLALTQRIDSSTYLERASTQVIRQASQHPIFRTVMLLPPSLKVPHGITRETVYLGEFFRVRVFPDADLADLRGFLSAKDRFSYSQVFADQGRDDLHGNVKADKFESVVALAERSDVWLLELRAKRVLHGHAQGPDAPCSTGSDCQSGICEGQGCGPDEGRCAKLTWRICGNAETVWCGCDGRSFKSPSTCPGQRFLHEGACGRATRLGD